jgi:hypothetical protein
MNSLEIRSDLGIFPLDVRQTFSSDQRASVGLVLTVPVFEVPFDYPESASVDMFLMRKVFTRKQSIGPKKVE